MGLVVLLLALAQGGPGPALGALGRGVGIVSPATPADASNSDILPLQFVFPPTPQTQTPAPTPPPTQSRAGGMVPTATRQATRSTLSPTAATSWTFADEKYIDAMLPAIVSTLKERELSFRGAAGQVNAFYPGDGYAKLWARDLATILPVAQYLYGENYLRSGVEELLIRQYSDDTRSTNGDNGVLAGAGALPGIVAPDGSVEKDTVTSDEETSAILAAYRYYRAAGGVAWLKKDLGGRSVLDRLNAALEWLYSHRLDNTHRLVKRGHTTDWGDVKFERALIPTDIDPKTDHWTASIYDQALTYRALLDLAEMNQAAGRGERAAALTARAEDLRQATNRFLWMPERGYYRLHIHLTPLTHHGFNEDDMVSIGNAMAMYYGLTNDEQERAITRKLEEARLAAKALKPGLSLFPAYPAGFFATVQRNRGEYQNGGLWDWWGGVQVTAEFENGYSDLALAHLYQIAADWARHPNDIWEWSLPTSSFGRGSKGYASAAATVGEAVVRGLYGVSITRDDVRLEPRLSTHNGRIRVAHPATGRAVSYDYAYSHEQQQIQYATNGAGEVLWRVLIPSGRLAQSVLLDGQTVITPRRETTGNDSYAVFKSPAGTHSLIIVLKAAAVGAGGLAIDPAFFDYYQNNDGARLLGAPLGPAIQEGTLRVQYFEKGKLEDHRQSTNDPLWRFSYGLLGEEMARAGGNLPVGGEMSTLTYDTLKNAAAEDKRVAPPKGFTSGVHKNKDGTVFIPFSADLKPAAGHNVAAIFWVVLSSDTRSPGGWLHDVGLPLTEPVSATVTKGDQKNRRVLIQAFQRAILTYDAQNTPGWQVERVNIGVDYMRRGDAATR